MFIDNSNVFIEGQKYFAVHNQLKVRNDQRFRVDIGELVSRLVGHRQICFAKLYGSEPPKLDTVWSAIRAKKIAHNKWIEVDTFHRNFKGKEKQVDCQLVADMTVHVCENKDCDTFVIVSGDQDFMPCMMVALKRGCNVEIASFAMALSKVDKKLSQYLVTGQLKIIKLDDIILDCASLALEWRPKIPRERSFVLQFASSVEDKSYCCEVTQKLTRHLKYQCMFKQLPGAPQDLVIIICTCESNKDAPYDFRKIVRFPQIKVLATCEEVADFVIYVQKIKLPLIDDDQDNQLDDANPHEWFKVPTRLKPTYIMFSDKCKYSFCCINGSKCKYTHADEERKFFKNNNGKGQKGYKTDVCKHFELVRCYKQQDPVLCPYAHGMGDVRCYTCNTIGAHFADDCPDKALAEIRIRH